MNATAPKRKKKGNGYRVHLAVSSRPARRGAAQRMSRKMKMSVIRYADRRVVSVDRAKAVFTVAVATR